MHRACTVTPMEQEGFTPLSSAVVLCVQFVEELASGRPDTNTVDVAYLEVLSGGPEGRAVDKDAVNDGPDRGAVPYLSTTVAICSSRCPSW